MSSGAVAASDPGGGEPKLVAGADVEMTEAADEVAAPAAEVKAEGKAAVATDAVREGGDAAPAAVSDPLYETESAGMVSEEGCQDEPVKGAEAVNGGDGGEVTVQAGAEGQLSEAETKPVPVPVGHAEAAGQEVEAAGSVASTHAEAESHKLEENHINAEPGGENREIDNGVAHSDEEIQNNVPVDVEGSTKIHGDDGAPEVDQPGDGSEMPPQTGEQFTGSGDNPGSNEEAASLGNVDQGARYTLPPLEKGGFQVSDLVWGKVKSHPWWPGEIFDQSDASELALKHQKKGSHLVAYFGDNTFAWCDDSQLKPFVPNYSQMEKQSNSDAFVGSVNNALEELSRRILSGMSCSCLPEELCDNGMSYTVENAGLKDGVTCSAVNRLEILKSFSPVDLLTYIKELALFPGQGGDLLELVIACSQLTSFYRSKGCAELASFQSGDAWVEDGLDGMDTLSTQNVMVEEAVINEVHPTQDKPKRGRGRPRKQRPEDSQEEMKRKDTSNLPNDTTYDEKQMAIDFDDFDNFQNKKKRNFDSFEDPEKSSFEDPEKSSAPIAGSSFKIGECIRRAASQLTGSSSIVKAQNEPMVYKHAAEAENGEFDISSDDAVDELTVEKRAKRRRMHRNHTADPKELLSQLCLVATEPTNGYNFSAMIISYFNDYRNYVVSTTTEASIVEKGTSRRGRKRKEVLPSPEVETTDHMQDSYWSGLSLHNHPIHDLRKESSTTRPRRRRRSSKHTDVPLSELGDSVPKKQIQVLERSIIHVDEKMVDELKPTALVLSFGRSAAIPSEMDLVKMFSRYGPLKETETEVHKATNTVKVVFKKRADAERAFSVAGKYGTFGPSLRSYRLVNMPFSLSTLEANNPVKHSEDLGTQIPGSNKSETPQDAMEVDQVDKTEKEEVVGEPSVEQVGTVKQTSQVEAADTEFVNQIDTVVGEPSVEQVGTVKQTSQVEAADTEFVNQIDAVEKTGKSDAELIDNVTGAAAQAESVAKESSEQVGNIEQAYTQKDASAGCLPDITQSEAVTGVSSGGTVDEIHQGEAPNQSSIDDRTDGLQMEAASEAQTLHSGAIIKESPQDVSDNMQTDNVAEAPKQTHISGENAVFEAVAEVPSTAEVDNEVDAANEVPEEHMASPELQSQNFSEKPVEQDATVEKLGSEALKQESGEVPCTSKLEAETLVVEPVGQDAVEQAAVEVEPVPEASGVQLEVGDRTPEDDSLADASTGETVEKKGVPVEENVESVAAVELVKETAEGEIKEEAPDSKIGNKAAADPLAGEAREGGIAVEAPDGKTENKAVAESVTVERAEDQTTAAALDEDTRTADGTVEDVKAVDDNKIASAEKPVDDATAATADEKTTMVEKTVEDAMVEPSDEKTTTAEKNPEDAVVEPLGAKTTEADGTTEDDMVEPPGVETTEAKKTQEDAMVEPPGAETTEAKKTPEDAMVEPSGTKTTEAEKTAEGTTVKEPDEKGTAAEKTIEDTTVEAPDVQAGASE